MLFRPLPPIALVFSVAFCLFFISIPQLSAKVDFGREIVAKVDFGREILPILKEKCLECHGPSQQMYGLRLDRRKDAIPNRIGANGATIVPGKSEQSLLYKRLNGTKPGVQMPPAGPLAPEQIALIKTWIDEGADWPDAFSGDRGATTADPAVEKLATGLRNGNRQAIQRILRDDAQSVNHKGRSGWTPLMYAAVYGKSEDLSLLLDKGANPNEQNDDGATALMYSVDDPAKTRILLEKGANANLRSGQGRTALLIAAGLTGAQESVKLLLEKGADAKAQASNGLGAISFAIFARNATVIQLLLQHDAPKKPLALSDAADCKACLDLLLPLADEQELGEALEGAFLAGNVPLVQELLDRGAKPRPDLLQATAMSPAPVPPEMVRALISRGAKVDSKTSTGITLIDFASRQGNTNLVSALREAGVRDEIPGPPSLAPKPAASVRAAIERSLPLLQRADVTFLQKAGCVSCHNNSLTAMTVSAARAKGLPVDNRIAKDQLRRIAAFLEDNSAGGMENVGIPGWVDTLSYILLGLAAENYPSDMTTEVWARYLKNLQHGDGSWRAVTTGRPPIESSDFQVTGASVRALRAFGLKSQQPGYAKSVTAGVRWLEAAQPKQTEDYAFKLLGLVWGGGSQQVIRTTAMELLAQQRADGGWGQIAALLSDAYATGQALYSIRASGVFARGNSKTERGTRYLLETQLGDGSWYVRSRSPAFQPQFDSDFPHGYDQFISAAATNWATLALIAAVK